MPRTPIEVRPWNTRTSVTGKRSFGLTIRGQGNFGKYSVLRGSVVLVSYIV